MLLGAGVDGFYETEGTGAESQTCISPVPAVQPTVAIAGTTGDLHSTVSMTQSHLRENVEPVFG